MNNEPSTLPSYKWLSAALVKVVVIDELVDVVPVVVFVIVPQRIHKILDDGSIKILFYPEEKERSAASKLWGTIFYR